MNQVHRQSVIRRSGRSRLFGISLACLVAGAGAFALGRYTRPNAVAPAVALTEAGERAETSEVIKRLAALEREVRTLRAATPRAAAERGSQLNGDTLEAAVAQENLVGAAEPANPGEAEVKAKPLSEEEESRRVNAGLIQFWDTLAGRLDSEEVDPDFRREAQAAIAQVVPERLGPQVSVGDVNCASTLCRVKLTHPNQSRIPDNLMLQLTLHRGELLGPMEMQIDVREPGATSIYFLRAQQAANEPE